MAAADSTSKQPETKKPSFDAKAIEAKCKEVRNFYNQFVGKPGYNPHFYIHNKVEPVERALSLLDDDTTDDVKQKIADDCAKLEMLEKHADVSGAKHKFRPEERK